MNQREQQARQTYEKIILTADQLLANSTFEALSVDQLCSHAGISKGGFYHHFSSKEQLISILIGRQMGLMIAQRVEPNLGKKSAYALLKIYVDTMAEYQEKYPRNTLARCWTVMAEHPEVSAQILFTDVFQLLREIVTQGKREGTIRPALETEFCVSYLNGVISGILLQGSTFRENLPTDNFLEDALGLIFHTLS